MKRCQPFERLSAADKDWLHLNWLCDSDSAKRAVLQGGKLDVGDLLSEVPSEVTDERAAERLLHFTSM